MVNSLFVFRHRIFILWDKDINKIAYISTDLIEMLKFIKRHWKSPEINRIRDMEFYLCGTNYVCEWLMVPSINPTLYKELIFSIERHNVSGYFMRYYLSEPSYLFPDIYSNFTMEHYPLNKPIASTLSLN